MRVGVAKNAYQINICKKFRSPKNLDNSLYIASASFLFDSSTCSRYACNSQVQDEYFIMFREKCICNFKPVKDNAET